ncbi:FAD-dependent oxidoreductase [Ostreiculturibacter nitratireducens]|uniref:oxidoreductase n=1 Tax=Ostreiculturibacter nitratireducens TaxID=3075226 RepID=UPI0031B6213B
MTAQPAFPNLFQPLSIGGVTVRNRIVSTGHDTTMPTDGTVNDRLVAYHRARAAGGVGLIVCQVTGVHESARYTNHVLMGADEGCIEGFAKLADAVHAEGATLFVQLFHPGREMTESLDGTAPVAWAPSVSPSERFHVIPRALTLGVIREIVAGYGATAARLQRAGVDGVEIVASHGYLPAQFLNPAVNRREDDYGGSDENRRRFLQEAIEAARAATSPEFVVGLRISGDEMHEGGLTPDISLDAIRSLADKIDYVSVVAGSSASLGGAVHIVPPMYLEPGYVAPFAARVKKAVAVPVIVTGRINQPQEAERIVASGAADMCGMTRALICDPQMPAKAQAGRFDDIRACIGCNQACIGHFHKGHAISCIQHPESGRELSFGTLRPASTRRKVMVIGGGPGGMKTAAVAALRGHEVTLHEAEAQLGGQARLAQLLPRRGEFGGIITNLQNELEQSGAQVLTRSRVDRELIEKASPEVVILATGATPLWPSQFHYDGKGQVVDAWQVLQGGVNTGGSVVVADWKGDWIGMGIAELLAERGCHVRLAVNGLFAGELLQSYVRDANAARLHALGVEIIPYARLFGRDEDNVYLQHTASGEAMIIEDVATLVLAQGHSPDTALQDGLGDFEGQLIAIGDCQMPRSCEEAVLEGLRAAWSI